MYLKNPDTEFVPQWNSYLDVFIKANCLRYCLATCKSFPIVTILLVHDSLHFCFKRFAHKYTICHPSGNELVGMYDVH